MNTSPKSRGTAIILWLLCFFGICGIHRIYIGKPISGIFQLLTCGLLGIWQFIDLILLLGNWLKDGEGRELSC